MSKLSEQLKIDPTSRKPVIRSQYIDVKESVSDMSPTYDYLKQAYSYSISVTFKSSVVITDDLTSNIDNSAKSIWGVKYAILEEVFGEFRQPIIQAIELIYQNKNDLAIEKLNHVLEEMFKVE